VTDTPEDASEEMPDGVSQSPPSPGDTIPNDRSDRVFGLVSLLFGIWYVLETRNFVITEFGTGPVGPRTLPVLLGIAFSSLALVLIVKPGESPEWGSITVWWRIAAVVAISFLYGQLLEPLGFVAASTLMAIVIGLFFRGPIAKLVPLSLAFAIVIAFIFNNWLRLQLPTGWWGGF